MHFLLEVDKNKVPKFDFVYTLYQALEFNNNFNHTNYTYEFITYFDLNYYTGDLDKSIPIGSLDFVNKFCEMKHNVLSFNSKPINIPTSLMQEKYISRRIEYVSDLTDVKNYPIFIKDNNKYKGLTDILYEFKELPKGEYLISEIIDIESEFRIFVSSYMIVSIKQYSGEYESRLNLELIKEMIYDYNDSPHAYTLDVGILANGNTVLLEVHPLVSCGLYGMSRFNMLPVMMINGFKYYEINNFNF